MRSGGAGAWPAVLGLALLFAAALIALFNSDFAGGEVYPEYSTLRADPGGAKLLFDSLARVPGVNVSRNFMPLANLAANGSTVVLLGLHGPDLDAIEKLAKSGARVVAALRADWEPEPKESAAIFDQWQVRLEVEAEKPPSRLYFSEARGWSATEGSGGKLTAIERPFGRGTVALLAASGDFSNQSTVEQDSLPEVTAALGSNSRIVFDESHLGIAESGSVVGLARRFHMMGMAAGLAIFAALFIWRNASSFPNVRQASGPAGALTGRTSASGLLTLLRKNIPQRDLTAACWQEWLAARRREFSPERVARAEAIAKTMSSRPLEAAREIQAVLHSKGAL